VKLRQQVKLTTNSVTEWTRQSQGMSPYLTLPYHPKQPITAEALVSPMFIPTLTVRSKPVARITYTVLVETLNPAQSINQSM